MFVNSAVFIPNSKDLANNYLEERIYQSAGSVSVLGFRRKFSMLLAVPNRGVRWGSGTKSTFLILTPSDGQASLTIGELQCLAVLYYITMEIVC